MKKKRLMTRTVILLILGAAVAYTLYANFTKDDSKRVAVGEQAPDFIVTDLNGNKHRLSEYKGQGVFLNFWGTFCKPCEKEMPYINNQYHQFKDQGVQVLALDVKESELVVSKFVERHQLDFPVAIDTDGQIQDAYGIDPIPATFLIDKEGKVVKYYTGQLTEAMVKDFMEQIKP
ncbi:MULTISPECIES: thiol-disulfide oxidoreductase ResA [unclassified Bacillus (in: firmicutes)]|uniref:thiol-disulfide oxidoreductase ResA n=1 Tax=unclassified Bacillus (in: firmicutes) TaxID=185979 RepID=UPI0008EFB7B4|nr:MULTISPECIES: thiol-disulfide oxidoreductase ResA [unclassified Bacillus (in: firmicutes)]SFA98007.1 Peroxiredoxin [Bacillus sp. UNCCL13]SFQ80773.1 Peroxiredoxin [Bacillus sp. cl95]